MHIAKRWSNCIGKPIKVSYYLCFFIQIEKYKYKQLLFFWYNLLEILIVLQDVWKRWSWEVQQKWNSVLHWVEERALLRGNMHSCSDSLWTLPKRRFKLPSHLSDHNTHLLTIILTVDRLFPIIFCFQTTTV